MASRNTLLTTFDADKVIQPIYTGGDVALDRQGRILVTCLGEDAVLTDLDTGQALGRVEGVGMRTCRPTDDCTNSCPGWRGSYGTY